MEDDSVQNNEVRETCGESSQEQFTTKTPSYHQDQETIRMDETFDLTLTTGMQEEDDEPTVKQIDSFTHEEDMIPPETSAASRPTIVLCGGNLHLAVSQAEQIFLASGSTIFQSGSRLVRVVSTTNIGGAKSLMIHDINQHWLRVQLTSLITWLKQDHRSGDQKPIDAPPHVATSLMSRLGHWCFPRLHGVIETPTLRSDGTVLEQPGFDPTSCLYYDPIGVNYPPLPPTPSREDAMSALNVLRGVLRGFPFLNETAFSVAIAAILTALVRRSIRTAPLFVFTAPTMGTGKTLLSDVVSMIATGNPAPVMPQVDNHEEERKRVFSLLLQGVTVICIDNVERVLKSDTLCIALTQPVLHDRILGQSKTATVSTATTWIATGNNVVVGGDLTSRTIVCQLDAMMEQPETRSFESNLHHLIPEIRPQLVAAALTILLAYQVAGRPRQGLTTFGRFEEWSIMIRDALVWLGLPDPVTSRVIVEAVDPSRNQLSVMLDSWQDTVGEKEVTTMQLIGIAARNPPLSEVLNSISGNHQPLDTRRIGIYLGKVRDRIDQGRCIRSTGKRSRDGGLFWKLEVSSPKNVNDPNHDIAKDDDDIFELEACA